MTNRYIKIPKFKEGFDEEITLPEVVITPNEKSKILIERGKQLIPDKQLRYDLAVGNMSADPGSVNANRQYKNMLDLYEVSGKPNIVKGVDPTDPTHSKLWYKWKNFWNKLGLAKDYSTQYRNEYNRSYYIPSKNTMYLGTPNAFYNELPHAFQHNNDFMIGDNIDGGYNKYGTTEYNAHHGILPAMYYYGAKNRWNRNEDEITDWIKDESNFQSKHYNSDSSLQREYEKLLQHSYDKNAKWYRNGKDVNIPKFSSGEDLKVGQLSPYGGTVVANPVVYGKNKRRLKVPDIRELLFNKIDPVYKLNKLFENFIMNGKLPEFVEISDGSKYIY